MKTIISGSIRNRLVFYFLLVLLIPIITLGLIGNIIYSSSIEKEVTNHTIQMIQQVNKNIEFYIEKIQNIIEYESKSSEIIDFMRIKSLEDESRINIETDLRTNLRSIKESNPEIKGILLVNENGIYISNELYRIKRNPLTDEIWYKEAFFDNELHIFSRPIGRNLTTSLGYSADDIVSVAKVIKDPETKRNIGVMLIDMNLDTVKKILEDIKLGKSGCIFVMDSNGQIVNAPINKIVYRVKNEWISNEKLNMVEKTIKNDNYQILYSVSNYTNWKTVGVFSLDETLKEVIRLRYYSFLIAIITLFLAMMIALFFTSRISNPISKLKKLMKQAEGGNLEVQFENKYNDEIGQLGNSFNNMINEIKKLIKLVYIEQKKKREAEIRILQSQIKPHFLYNTLDTIHWMAQRHSAEDIVEIIGALSKLFRIGLSKGKEFIKVSEEIEHVKSYLIIQKARYEDKLEYEIFYEEEVMNLYMLKFSLQPLVENAIYHGIKEKRGNGRIKIFAKCAENKLYFSITDDGIGIKADKLYRINEILHKQNERNSEIGYGIYNVNERIKLSFGEEYGLKYNSEVVKGTTVEIFYPVIEKWGKYSVEITDS